VDCEGGSVIAAPVLEFDEGAGYDGAKLTRLQIVRRARDREARRVFEERYGEDWQEQIGRAESLIRRGEPGLVPR
jgi:hypothetical protein